VGECFFWYWLTQVILDKIHRAINSCSSIVHYSDFDLCCYVMCICNKLLGFVNWMLLGAEAVDWCYAQHELLEKQGVDLRKEMQSRSVCLSFMTRTFCQTTVDIPYF